jgi:hypothetical protein
VVAYCDRFDCFDTAFHGDGSGAQQIAQSLVMGRIFNRTIGPARAPFSWRRKSANQATDQFKLGHRGRKQASAETGNAESYKCSCLSLLSGQAPSVSK